MRVTFDDGQYVDFDGDDPISDEDIAWAEQQVYGSNEPVKKPTTFGEKQGAAMDKLPGGFFGPKDIAGDLEAGLNVLSGVPGMVAGGIAGAGKFIGSGGDIDAANETMNTVSGGINDYVQYEPKSTRGKEASEAFAWMNKTLSEKSGELGSDLTGGSNAGHLAGNLIWDIGSNLIPLSPALKGAKAKPIKARDVATTAKEMMAKKKAKVEEAAKPAETPVPDALPELLPELKAQAADMPPMLPESISPETPLPILENTPAPTLPARGGPTKALGDALPEIDPNLLGPEKTTPGMIVEPVAEVKLPLRVGGKQKGFINLSVFEEAGREFKKTLDNGLEIVAKSVGTKAEPMLRVSILKDGQETKGGAVFKPSAKAVELKDNHLVGHVGLPENMKKQGLAEEMYRFVAELGNDIKPGQGLSDAGQGMWKGFHERGIATGGSISAFPAKALKDAGVSPEVSKAFINAQRGQRGHVDIDGGSVGKIADYLGKVRKNKTTTSPLFDQEKQIDAMNKIPGMGMKAYIPEDISVVDVKKDLSSLPDLPDSDSGWDRGIGNKLTGSKEMQAQMKRNPAMYSVGKWLTNARKRGELYDQVALKNLQRDITKSLKKEEAGPLMSVLMEESVAKLRFTPEELNQLLSPSQVDLYTKMRSEYDIALARQNQALKAAGKKEITPHEAYISSRWGGQYRTPIFDKQGNVVWWIAERTRGKAKNALEWIKKNEPDLDFSRSKIEYKNKSMGAEGKESFAGYRETLALLDEDAPLTQRLNELYQAKLEAEGYRMYGHDKHFEPKSGTKGYHGARPWINDAADISAFYESQMNYLREAHMWSEQQSAISKISELTHDPVLQKSHPNTLDWIRQTARAEMGMDTSKLAAGIEHTVSQAFGISPSQISKGISKTKGYFYSTKLGFFNAPFAAMSIVQPVFTIPHHIRLSDQGFSHNPAKTLMDSVSMTAATILPKMGGDLAHKKVGPVPYIPQLYKDAFKYMEANGIVNLNQFSDVGHIDRGPKTQAAFDIINYSITAPEKIARTTAFMGYVSHLDQSGKFKGKDSAMFQKAEELTNLSMANFKHTERAPAFNRMGMTGDALVTLQTFKINQLNQLADFWKGAKTGEGVKPFAMMLAIQLTMAGTMGLYGVETAEWMWKWFKKGLNDRGYYEDWMEGSPKKWMLENMPTWASMGAPSALTGKDYHSRMDQGTILDPTFAGMFPFIADLAEQGKDVVTALADPTKENWARAGYSVTPSTFKGTVEMNTPTLTGAPGQGDSFSVDRPDEPLYKRTQADKDARDTLLHGVPTTVEAREKMVNFKRREAEQLKTRQISIQTDKFHAASRMGNDEDKVAAIRKIARLDGPWEALLDGEIAQLEKRATTADEKNQLKATQDSASLQLLQKVKRQLESTRKVRENH